MVVPPAGSVRMPSVAPSRSIAAKISSSETAAAEPPRLRTASRTRLPSPGAPIASECAAVAGDRRRDRRAAGCLGDVDLRVSRLGEADLLQLDQPLVDARGEGAAGGG